MNIVVPNFGHDFPRTRPTPMYSTPCSTNSLQKLLSDQRFIESLVRRRAERFGAARIQHELRTHQLSAEQLAPALEALKASELERAQEVWQRRFGEAPASREERLRQMRFLAGRGFAAEVIRKVVGAAGRSCSVAEAPDDL